VIKTQKRLIGKARVMYSFRFGRYASIGSGLVIINKVNWGIYERSSR